MHDVLNPRANPVTWAVPFFGLFIGIELATLATASTWTGATAAS